MGLNEHLLLALGQERGGRALQGLKDIFKIEMILNPINSKKMLLLESAVP